MGPSIRDPRYILGVCAAVMLMSVATSGSWAAQVQIGQIKKVAGDTTILRAGERLHANVGGPVYQKDVIDTGADGAIGITFTDNTVMSAGPNSEVSLEDYRFDSDNFNGEMLTDMRKGTLSVVSGDIARSSPGAMRVKTPTAILGVRGTRFLIHVGDAP